MIESFFINGTYSEKIWSWLPKWQAHRGHWVSGLKENTLPAIQKAFELGYEMVEFDVHQTKDQHIVLFHDETVSNQKITDLRLDEIKNLTEVSTLEEVLSWWQQTCDSKLKLKFNIEIKSGSLFSDGTEKLVFKLIKKFSVQKQVLVSSFNPFSLYRMRRLASEIFRAQLVTLENHPKNKWFLKKMVFNFLSAPHALHVNYQHWPTIQKILKNVKIKIPVILWTVNDPLIAKNYLVDASSEVHGIITDQILPD